MSGSNEDALQQLAGFLFAEGIVTRTYANALIDREAFYPTTTQSPSGIGLELPHADAQHVHRPALVIGNQERPIQFGSGIRLRKRREQLRSTSIPSKVVNALWP